MEPRRLSRVLLREDRLAGVHPDLVRVVREAAKRLNFDLIVLEGLRTKERQAKLMAQGASTTLKSRHLTGHALDVAPCIDTDSDGDVEVSWHWPHYHKIAPVMKQCAQELGVKIEWGGDWKSFKDGPHWQLPWKHYPAQA